MLKHLTVEEMVGLLSPWVGKTKRRAVFLSIPEIAPLHPTVEGAYQAVLAVRPVSNSTSPQERKLTEKLARTDNRHDHLARAVYHDTQAEVDHCLAADPPETERAALCERALAEVFPDGLAVLNTSYLNEAGNTARVGKLLSEDAELSGLLKSIPVRPKKTLLDTTHEWIDTGKALEALEHERDEIAANKAVAASPATIQAARSRWFKVVSAILTNLEISSAPAKAIEAIRGPVVRASDRAGKRYASGKLDENVLDNESEDGSGDEPAPESKPT
ncbi:MAG: hypothetical protein IPK82_31425 [Polyangiaceae bacterium]|nr:hypothetical protein [Polyangiaceae bacterium]